MVAPHSAKSEVLELLAVYDIEVNAEFVAANVENSKQLDEDAATRLLERCADDGLLEEVTQGFYDITDSGFAEVVRAPASPN